MSGEIVQEAEQLITTYGKTDGLRSLDALHIACWILNSENDLIFVTSDTIQDKVIHHLNGELLFIELNTWHEVPVWKRGEGEMGKASVYYA